MRSFWAFGKAHGQELASWSAANSYQHSISERVQTAPRYWHCVCLPFFHPDTHPGGILRRASIVPTLTQATHMSATDLDGLASRLDREMVELTLLLPSWQATSLEMAAQDQGLTTGQMVRQVIHDFFSDLNTFGPLSYRRRINAGGPGA
jgi:hypothetical protein